MICDFCGKTLPGTASHYLKLDVKYVGEQNACLLCGPRVTNVLSMKLVKPE